jgi:putative MATE family efflux protein
VEFPRVTATEYGGYLLKRQNDLGKDSVGGLIVRLAVPAIAAQLINALYNMVDRAYIGHMGENGDLALTGLGLTFPIIMLISAFSSLIGMGGAPLAAIRMGEGNNRRAEQILGNCFGALLFLAVVLTGVFFACKVPLLRLFGASDNTLPFANNYLTIYLIGTIFVQIALGMNSFINTQGFAKTGMLTVAIGAVLNILLDPLFIFVFNMGVQGAALATVISQAVSALWVLWFLFGKKTVLRIRRENLLPKWRVLLPVLGLGISPFVMQSTESLLSIVLNANLYRYGGDPAVGSMTIISSCMQMFMMPLTGLGQGAQPIISYNYGAGQFDRARKAFRIFIISSFSASTLIWALVMAFPQLFIGIFSNQEALREATVPAMRIFLGMIFMLGAQTACQQTFLALGQAKVSLFLAMLRKVILLIPLVYILSPHFGVNGVFAAEPIADCLASLATVAVFAFRYKRLLGREAEEKMKLQGGPQYESGNPTQ